MCTHMCMVPIPRSRFIAFRRTRPRWNHHRRSTPPPPNIIFYNFPLRFNLLVNLMDCYGFEVHNTAWRSLFCIFILSIKLCTFSVSVATQFVMELNVNLFNRFVQ